MKNRYIPILTTALLFAFLQSVKAQSISTEPLDFSANEKVTITVDVTGTDLDGVEPLYIWAWIELGEDDINAPTNGDWTNSDEANVMTKIEDNQWSITFTSLADFYQQTAGTIGSKIGFLIKARDGSGGLQTNDQTLNVEPPKFTPSVFRVFPANFAQDDIVTIFYDRNLDENTSTNSLTEYALYATALLESDETLEPVAQEEVQNRTDLLFKDQGNGLFSLTMIPAQFFGVRSGQRIRSTTFIIRSKADAGIALAPRVRLPFQPQK